MTDTAQPASGSPVVTIFRSRLRPEADGLGYGELAAAMEARAREAAGFLDFKTFVASDGERLALVVFDSPEHQSAWRCDAQHRVAQERGRSDFYEAYSITVAAVGRAWSFRRGDTPGCLPTLGATDSGEAG